jgi:CRISPR-associated protein Cst1
MLNLDFTGHPYFDIGLAAITALAEKDRPTDLEEEDLAKAADFIDTYYTQQPLTSFLTVSLMNSDFTQPAFKDKPERRHGYAKRVARSFGSDVPTSDETCVFTGEPALGLSLSLKTDKNGQPELPPGRAYRQHIPLITGEGTINFSPWGDPGLPVSGKALLCLQFFPMGCRKCSGRLLAVHSDNPAILMAMAREALHENMEGISLARATGETKLPDASPSAQTLIVQTLVSMDQQRFYAREDRQPYSVTAYHLTNSGQSSPLDEKSPPLKTYHLPMPIVRFLGKMYQPDYKPTWNALVARGKERPKVAEGKQDATKSGTKEVKSVESGSYHARNYFCEDVLRLPDEAPRFVRKYFLRVPDLHVSQTSAPADDSSDTPKKEGNLVPWSFIVLFLKEVLHVDKQRIEEIGKLGERLAAYVKEFDDKRFFSKFYELQRADYFRSELLRALKNAASRSKPPLFRFEEFCTVFFELNGEDLRLDWKLARDLVFIRMLEWLYDHDDKLQEHVSALIQERDTEDSTSSNGQ